MSEPVVTRMVKGQLRVSEESDKKTFEPVVTCMIVGEQSGAVKGS